MSLKTKVFWIEVLSQCDMKVKRIEFLVLLRTTEFVSYTGELNKSAIIDVLVSRTVKLF